MQFILTSSFYGWDSLNLIATFNQSVRNWIALLIWHVSTCMDHSSKDVRLENKARPPPKVLWTGEFLGMKFANGKSSQQSEIIHLSIPWKLAEQIEPSIVESDIVSEQLSSFPSWKHLLNRSSFFGFFGPCVKTTLGNELWAELQPVEPSQFSRTLVEPS